MAKTSDVSLHECGGYSHHGFARSVSWNSTGSWLAMGGPSPRIWSMDPSGRCTEVLSIAGHTGACDRVRFHPSDSNCLATSAMDGTVRVWDVRSGTERAVGRVDIQSGKSANYIDWCSINTGSAGPAAGGGGGVSSSVIAITERDGSVRVYDARKISGSKATPLSTFQIANVDMDACIFSPSGNHLVAATAPKGEMLSDLRIWSWKDGSEAFSKSLKDNTQFTVPAHTGPIFSLAFSPDGKRLATGSSDSLVGLWDVATMCCTATIARRLKLIRGVAFSHDSKWLANCNEEDGIDIASANTGEAVGILNLRENPSGSMMMGATGGADECAFNPAASGQHVLACARAPLAHMSSANLYSVVVIKCRITS